MIKPGATMVSIAILVDACCEAMTNGMLPAGSWVPMGATTYCNYSVNFIAKKMGCNDFHNKTANDMAMFLDSTKDSWLMTTGWEAQHAANEGKLVVAAWYNPQDHGHVAVVRPGVAEHSAKWNSIAPKIINIGRTNFIDKGANWGFSEEPKYYIWRES